jgi:hypothetical protein
MLSKSVLFLDEFNKKGWMDGWKEGRKSPATESNL